MELVADTVTPQPISASVTMPQLSLEEAVKGEGNEGERLLVVCVGVRDPGNLGSVVRSAAAAGASAVVCCDETADPYNPKTVRATAGAIFALPVVVERSASRAVGALADGGLRLLATTARDGTDYLASDLSGELALLLGNEAAGLPSELLEHVDEAVTIPMRGGVESLNVAMTATLLCYEVARRRARGTTVASSLLPDDAS
jgi:TrmH family RNA methyltransferase